MIALDADYLCFMCTESKWTKSGAFGREEGSANGKKYKEPLVHHTKISLKIDTRC